VKVASVLTQHNLKTVGGYDPRLDLLAEDEEGRRINIEVQRTKKPDLILRGRYYSAVLDANILPKGASFSDLPETYIIFITADDFRGKGLPVYELKRFFVDDGEPGNDGTSIMFINGEYRGDDPIGRLMNDFNAVRAKDMKNAMLAEGMKFYKETDMGRRELSELEQKIYGEAMKERIDKVVLNMLKSGFSFVAIAKVCDYPESRIKELRDHFVKEGLLSAQ